MDPFKAALHEKTGCTWPACWPTDAQNHFALYLAEKELREITEASEEHLKAALVASLVREQALREALRRWNQAAWTRYGEPNAVMISICCRVCHQCRTIYPGTDGDPIVGDMRHGFGCWAEPLLAEAQQWAPFEIDHDSVPPTERKDRCPSCEGTGIGRKPDLYVCGDCGGIGLLAEPAREAAGGGT